MRALALVTTRELRAYTPAWIAAAVAALLPWLAPLLPTVGHQPPAEVRLGTAMVLATLLGVTISAFAGAGLMARDLADGRLGFFLGLPLPAWSIWAGKLLAAILLAYATIAAILLPAALAAGELPLRSGRWRVADLPPLGPELALTIVAVVLAPLFLILLAHHVATALRSRSPWLLLDLAGLAVAGSLIAAALLRLVAAAAPVELGIAAGVAAALALLALGLGGGFGLARGGVLLTRVHRAQASAIAAGLLVTALLASGFAHWVMAVDAGDVSRVVAAEAAPAGFWIGALATLERRPSYTPWMLVDSATGRSLPLSPGFGHPRSEAIELPAPLTFAADGRSAVWLRPQSFFPVGPDEAVWVELGKSPRLILTGVEVPDSWNTALLMADDRMVIAEPRRLAVWGERGRRLLVAAELPRARPYWQELRRLAANRLRLVRLADVGDEGARLQVWDLDVAGRRLEARVDRPLRGGIAAAEPPPDSALSADGTRLLLVQGWAGRGGVALLDAASGEPLAQLAPPQPEVWVTAGFLPGGRVAVVTGRDGRLTLRLHDRQGAVAREVALGAGRWAWLGAPWGTDLLPFTASVRSPSLGAAGAEAPSWQGELRAVDLASGRVRILGGRWSPLAGAAPWSPGDDRVPPGSPAAWLFRTVDGALVRLDADGRRHAVLPRPR